MYYYMLWVKMMFLILFYVIEISINIVCNVSIIYVGLCFMLLEINDFYWEYFEIRNRYKKLLNNSCLIFFLDLS